MKYGFPKGADRFPRMVVVNVSYVCNAKCVHCVYTFDPSIRKVVADNVFVSEEAFKKLADECGEYGTYIRITGTGEPLLNPNILHLIKYAKDCGCKVSMITNGSLLTQEKVDFLLKCNIDGIEISADAVSQVTYEAIRRGLNFERLLSNVRYLRQKRDEMGSPTNLLVSFVEEDLNRHERDLAEDFWVPAYVDKIQFRVWLQYGKMQPSEHRRNLMPNREPCPYPFERINMDSRGNFHLCAFDIDHETDYGNILDCHISQIWKNNEIEEVRRLLLARRFSEIPICSRCTDWGCRSWDHNFWKLQYGKSTKTQPKDK